MAGLRNDAAHGNFDDLSPERASLMEQQVNFFLSRLVERFEDALVRYELYERNLAPGPRPDAADSRVVVSFCADRKPWA